MEEKKRCLSCGFVVLHVDNVCQNCRYCPSITAGPPAEMVGEKSRTVMTNGPAFGLVPDSTEGEVSKRVGNRKDDPTRHWEQ